MADEESVAVDPLSVFPEQWRYPVEGLMYLGQLSDEIDFAGHSFGIRTLFPQDKLAIGVAMQPYRNTLAEVDAYRAVHVGVALTHVDHDENFCPQIGPDINRFATARLNWVAKSFFTPTIELLWGRLELLEFSAAKAIDEIDRLLQGGQPHTLPPWLDSLIKQGNSPDETNSDIQPSISSS